MDKVGSISVFSEAAKLGHEQVVYCHDEHTGLKAIIAIHNTVLGPALGGTRMWNYAREEEAAIDVLRLSRGMTYKAAVSGLNLGGGKAVIIGSPEKLKNETFLRRFGKFVNSLGGKYITAEDMNNGIITSAVKGQYVDVHRKRFGCAIGDGARLSFSHGR